MKPKKKMLAKALFKNTEIVDTERAGPSGVGEMSVSNQSQTPEITMDSLEPGDFILVKVGPKYWVGFVCQKSNASNKLETKFLRRKNTKDLTTIQFVYPNEEDICRHDASDVKLILPKPITAAGTGRVAARIMFDVDVFGDFSPVC